MRLGLFLVFGLVCGCAVDGACEQTLTVQDANGDIVEAPVCFDARGTPRALRSLESQGVTCSAHVDCEGLSYVPCEGGVRGEFMPQPEDVDAVCGAIR